MIPGGLPPYGAGRPPVPPHALAHAILSQPRFRVPVYAPPHRTVWGVILHWIGTQLGRLIGAFARNVHVGRGATVAIGDVLLVVALAVVVIVAIRLLAGSVRDAAYSGQRHAFGGGALDANALYEQSLAAARQSAYANAIALLFRAALKTLEEARILDDDPSRTVNQCRRAVRSRIPALASPFDRLARAFTGVLYAEEPVDRAQWENALEAYLSFVHRHADAA